MSLQNKNWQVWDREIEYGQLLYRRATGELPEMESSKALARIVKDLISSGDRILDVGCGAGHYLRSLQKEIGAPFNYVGVDVTAHYIELARRAWLNERDARFEVADVFSLPFQDGEYDVVVCSNLLLHLPSIKVPLREIVRVARKYVVVRTLIGMRSFRIQEVYSPETHPRSFVGILGAEEFDDRGEPQSFHFYNIYSQSYIRKLLSMMPGVADHSIIPDDQYDPNALATASQQNSAPDATQMIGNWQVNGYILQPWCFVKLAKGAAK